MKFSKITRHLNMKDVNRKQLQKEEALTETPTNSTSNVYPQTSEVPNQNVTDFETLHHKVDILLDYQSRW